MKTHDDRYIISETRYRNVNAANRGAIDLSGYSVISDEDYANALKQEKSKK